jgi:hypothetical protein
VSARIPSRRLKSAVLTGPSASARSWAWPLWPPWAATRRPAPGPVPPTCGKCGVTCPGGRKRQVSSHRPLRRPERSDTLDRGERVAAGRIEKLHTDSRAEQASEHVAIDERTEVAEHRLDLNTGGVGHQRPEAVLISLARFRDLHAGAPARRRGGSTSAYGRLAALPSIGSASFPAGEARQPVRKPRLAKGNRRSEGAPVNPLAAASFSMSIMVVRMGVSVRPSPLRTACGWA